MFTEVFNGMHEFCLQSYTNKVLKLHFNAIHKNPIFSNKQIYKTSNRLLPTDQYDLELHYSLPFLFMPFESLKLIELHREKTCFFAYAKTKP